MQYLRTAGFGGLFQVTFVVAATAQTLFFLLGLIGAVLSPSAFNLNGAPATNAGAAILADVMIFAVLLIFNAMISALGAGLWLLVRKVFPKPSSAEVF